MIGVPSQGIQNQLEFWVPVRICQVSRPGRANNTFLRAFTDKRILPSFAVFGPKVYQILSFLNFRNQPQVIAYFDYQNLKFGQKMFAVATAIQESYNFL